MFAARIAEDLTLSDSLVWTHSLQVTFPSRDAKYPSSLGRMNANHVKRTIISSYIFCCISKVFADPTNMCRDIRLR